MSAQFFLLASIYVYFVKEECNLDPNKPLIPAAGGYWVEYDEELMPMSAARYVGQTRQRATGNGGRDRQHLQGKGGLFDSQYNSREQYVLAVVAQKRFSFAGCASPDERLAVYVEATTNSYFARASSSRAVFRHM